MQEILGYSLAKLGPYLAANCELAVAAGAEANNVHDLDGTARLRWPDGHGDPPSVGVVAAWSPAPTATGMAELFAGARRNAPQALDQLKGAVWIALVSGGMAPAEATAAGVALVLRHAAPLAAFTAAGGHTLAAQALYEAIASEESVAALPWLTEPILAVFASALGQS